MTTFVINLENLESNKLKLVEQLKFYQERLPGKIVNFSFDNIIEEVEGFNEILEQAIEDYHKKIFVDSEPVDIYGNIYNPTYRYVEITYENLALLRTIRFLGVDGFEKKRFYISDVKNPFQITTLKLLQNIEEIIKDPRELELLSILDCKRNPWESDIKIITGQDVGPRWPYRYSWEELISRYFSPKPIYAKTEMTDAEIEYTRRQYERKSFQSKEEIFEYTKKIDQEKLRIAEKAKKTREKAETPIDILQKAKETGQPLLQYLDKFSIGCLIKEALSCVSTPRIDCKTLFKNLTASQILDRVQLVFPKFTETFRIIEVTIEQQILGEEYPQLKKDIKQIEGWISEDQDLLESLIADSVVENRQEISNLETSIERYQGELNLKKQELENILRKVSQENELSAEQEAELINGGGSISALIKTFEAESVGAQNITNAVIASIELIIPLEDLCEAITNALSFKSTFPFVNFEGLPPFEFPKPQGVSDIFSGFSAEINESFVNIVVQAIISFIDGIIKDLASCETLDNFIAQSINNNTEEMNKVNDLLNETGIEGILDNNFKTFLNTIAPRAANIATINGVNIGIVQNNNLTNVDSLTAIRETASTSVLNIATNAATQSLTPDLAQSLLDSQSNWDIDITGKKFEIISGTKLFDLSQIEKYLVNLNEEQKQKFSNLGAFTPRALADAAGIEEVEVTNDSFVELSLDQQQQQQLRNDLSCTFNNLTSVLLPSQVLKLLAGTATEETEQLAYEVSKLCSENSILPTIFNNQKSFSNMLNNFGVVAGLDTLSDDIEAISSSPESLVPNCINSTALEQFRQQLLTRVLQPEEAASLLQKLNQEKIDRFNELGNQILALASGSSINSITDRNKTILEALGKTITEPAQQQKSKNAQEQIEELISRKKKESPIINDMLDTVKASIFLPLENSINQDISSIVDAYSDVVEKRKQLHRTFIINDDKGNTQEVINREFRNHIQAGMIPVEFNGKDYAELVDSSSISSQQDNSFKVSGDPSRSYAYPVENELLKPIYVNENQKDIGYFLKKNIDNFNVYVNLEQEDTFQVTLSGSLKFLEQSDQFVKYVPSLTKEMNNSLQAIKDELNRKPSWSVNYTESINQNIIYNSLQFQTTGTINTLSNGKENFYIPNFSYNKSAENNNEFAELLRNNSVENHTRKQVFDKIIKEHISDLIYNREDINFDINLSVENKIMYKNFIESFIRSMMTGIVSSDLLKPVAQVSSNNSISKLETINFADDCNPLIDNTKYREEFDRLYDFFSSKKTNQTKQQLRSERARNSPMGNSSKLVISKIFIDLTCMDYIVRSLLSFDYIKYSSSIIENDMFLNLVCEFVDSELKRLQIAELVYNNVKSYYDIKQKEFNEYAEISAQEKRDFRFAYPIELKKIILNEFGNVVSNIKKIIGIEEEQELTKTDDFLFNYFNKLPLLNVHKSIGTEEQDRDSIMQDNSLSNSLVLQKYIIIPKINLNCTIVKENPSFFTPQKIQEINNYGILSFEKANNLMADIYYKVKKDFYLYLCEGSDCLFSEPYSVGMRVVNIKQKQQNIGPAITINNQIYPYVLERCNLLKAGFIKEKNSKEYDLTVISQENIKVNQDELVSSFIGRNNEKRYMSEFSPLLKRDIAYNNTTKLFFLYSLALKEMSTISIVHSLLANNNKKTKYLFEPAKKQVKNTLNYVSNLGNRTNSFQKLKDVMDQQKKDQENVGSPAGPVDFSALKLFYRTPIQLLRGIAQITDPNITSTNSVVSSLTIAGSLSNQKLMIPHGLTSLALLPAPLFLPPPAGIIPPLTAYNIVSPLGIIFLALEPLLWDLPYYKNNNTKALSDKQVCNEEE